MSDSNLNVELTAEPFVRAMKPVLDSLQEFKALVISIDNSGTGKVSKEMQQLKTAAVGMADELSRALGGVPRMIEDSIKKANQAAKASARRVGKEAGAEFATGMQEAASRVKIRVSGQATSLPGGIRVGASGQGLDSVFDIQSAMSQFNAPRDQLANAMLSGLSGKSAKESAAAFAAEWSREAARAASASPIDPRTILGLQPNVMAKSAQASAEVFKAQWAREAARVASASPIDPRTILGLQPDRVVKSAQSSAEVFKAQWAREAARAASASPIDPRTILGLQPNVMAKSAQASAEVFKAQWAREAARVASASPIDPRTILGLQPDRVANSARASAEVFALSFAEAAARNSAIDRNAAFAAMSPSGQLSRAARVSTAMAGGMSDADATLRYGSAAVEASRNAEVLRASLDRAKQSKQLLREEAARLRDGQRGLSDAFNTTHSAARGLASGFNAMWLTWGQLGPLLAGAAISNAFVSAVRAGADFEQKLAAIAYMGEASSSEIKQLSAAALDLSRSGIPQGPVEIADGLKTLALAGLDAREQLAAIRPVLNFSIAGEMELNKAAESLVGISTAYGYSAEGFGTVADVVSKAAAISMTSVTDMTEAFKQASTVAQQFGVSINDSATMLVLLGQIGIKGSAAGTSMRNMYNELLGLSKEAREVLKNTLKVEVVDNATRAMKPLVTIMEDMAGALADKDFESQMRILQALGNERGLKSLSAGLMAINQQAKEMGSALPNRLREIVEQLRDAPGFAATAAVGMSLTTQNQIKSIWATLQSSLVEAFQQMQPEIQAAANGMREVFGSDEFRQAVTATISAVAGITNALVQHADLVAAVAVGYVAAKSAMLLWVGGQAVMAGLQTLGYGLGIVAGRAAAAAPALAVFGAALNTALGPIGWIAAGLTAAAAAWVYFANRGEAGVKRVSEVARESAEVSKAQIQATIDGANAEIKRLDEEYAAMRRVLDGQIQAHSVQTSLARDRLSQLKMEEVQTEKTRHAILLKNNEETKGRLLTSGAISGRDMSAELAALDGRASDSSKRLADTWFSKYKAESEFDETMRQLRNKAGRNAATAAQIADSNRRIPTGGATFNPDEGAGSRRAAQAKDEFADLMGRLTAKDVGIDPNFYEDLNTLHEGYIKRRFEGVEAYRGAVELLINSQSFAKKAAEEEAEANKAATRALEDSISAAERAADATRKTAQTQWDELQTMGMSALALHDLEQARLADAAASLRRRATLMDDIDLSGRAGDAMREEAAEILRLADIKRETYSRNAVLSADDAIDEAVRMNGRVTDNLSDSLADSISQGILEGARNGSNIMDIFRRELEAQFARTILRPMVQPIAEGMNSLITTGLNALLNALGGGATGSGYNPGSDMGFSSTDWEQFVPNAKGNVFSGRGISAYSSQVVSRPTLFPFAKGIGLMGEAGPEAIMPLRRDSSGRLGVSAGGGGATNITVKLVNESGTPLQATSQRQTTGPGGETQIEVIVQQIENRIGNNLANRSGPVARGLEAGYPVAA